MEDRQAATPAAVVHGLTPLAAAFRFVEPTWKNYIKYVDAEARTPNPEAARYLAMWQALSPAERQSHMPEQVCELANVAAWDLVAWVTRQAYKEGEARSNLCMSFMRDRVLAKTAEFAMESPDNVQSARLFMQASGLLATAPSRPGGRPITINNTPIASSGSVAGAHSESSPVALSGLRGMDDEIVALSKIMQTDTVGVDDFTGKSIRGEVEDDDDDEREARDERDADTSTED